jgi:uncharacterized protein (TIGR00369 family)
MKDKNLEPQRADFLKKDFHRGFIQFCGYTALKAEWGKFVSEIIIAQEHRQQDGFIHAGVMATMADHTAGYAGFTIVPDQYQILTIEFKINFLRPAYGNKLQCRAKIIREGRQIIIAESDVYDCRETQEVPVAKAIVSLMAVLREKLVKEKK